MGRKLLDLPIGRRRLLRNLGLAGIGAFATPAMAADLVKLGFPGGVDERQILGGFPGKGPMIVLRTRAPLLETPMEVFDGPGVITPNDRFFVRWHLPDVPSAVDVDSFRLTVRGAVNKTLSLTLPELIGNFEHVEVTAINQCSGNSRGFFNPRVAGGQWGHGAMGNARWRGVRLKDVLDAAGVKGNAVAARFSGLDEPLVPDGADFKKSLLIDKARDGEVMIAFAMNGEALPILNGFPLRIIVPGWFSTYWVKMLNDIEVLDAPDDNFWMAKAYKLPDTPNANVAPTDKGWPAVPISTMVPRSFVTNLKEGDTVPAGKMTTVRGIAMGGTSSVRSVELSVNGGRSWMPTKLGPDEGAYSFRRFETGVTLMAGSVGITTRATNMAGETQTMEHIWNPGGYRQTGVETTVVQVV